jgi:hypothetical protein
MARPTQVTPDRVVCNFYRVLIRAQALNDSQNPIGGAFYASARRVKVPFAVIVSDWPQAVVRG